MADDTYSTDGPICPYCGALRHPDEAFLYSESLTELECERCEKTYRVSVYHSISWSCEPVPTPTPRTPNE